MAAVSSAAMETNHDGNHLLLEESHSWDANNDDGYDEFPLEEEEEEEKEEHKEDYFDTSYMRQSSSSQEDNSNTNTNAWVQLLNLPTTNNTNGQPMMPATGIPVGGMRRVSSCYFSLASNISNNEFHAMDSASFYSPNPSYHNSYHRSSSSSHHCNDALSFDGRNASDFLLHDVLMNVFSFLDAHSLASFSETGMKPNFECFYFLELQLQRALLVGDSHNYFQAGANDMMGIGNEGGAENDHDENLSNRDNDMVRIQDEPDYDQAEEGSINSESEEYDSNTIPSFEGAIAGTGVISRLASLNSASARTIVQTYLDSNSTIQAMPLSHSLAYFRQVLLRQYQESSINMPYKSPFPRASPNIPDNMAKNARNMALFVTFLGAAYMRTQHVGDAAVAAMPNMPDPSEVLNEENVEALKNMMLKVGLAGGFFKAGKTMKEKVAEQAANGKDGDPNVGSSAAGDDANDDHYDDVANQDAGHDQLGNFQGGEGSNPIGDANDIVAGVNNNASAEMDAAHEANAATSTTAHSRQQRSSSMGNLEDLSHMIPHPSAIASRLYNAFSSNSSIADTTSSSTAKISTVASLNASLDANNGSSSEDQQEALLAASRSSNLDEGDATTSPLPTRRQHRSKRSHKTLSHEQASISNSHSVDFGKDSGASWEENKSSEPEEEKAGHSPHAVNQGFEQVQQPILSPEAIAYAMDHPFSPNPYDHPSHHAFANSLDTQGKTVDSFNNIGNPETTSTENTSFFSFNMKQPQDPLSDLTFNGNQNVKPTGCIGAYAHGVKTAASEVTRLIKEERKANYDALSLEQQQEVGMRFIDACTDDRKLNIVKEILQKQKLMDVDRFFIGPDDTETCALHAAAFNGAEKVLQFLCGGIDERDPNEDCGLCNVNVRDANGWTALHFAAGANSVTSVRVLSEHGAELTIEASNGYTPFHWAERLSNEEVAGELERLGADNRFVGRWVFGSGGNVRDDRKIPFVSFLANQFFAFSS